MTTNLIPRRILSVLITFCNYFFFKHTFEFLRMAVHAVPFTLFRNEFKVRQNGHGGLSILFRSDPRPISRLFYI